MDEEQRVAQRIDGELRVAVAALEEVTHYLGDDSCPLSCLLITLYQDRCAGFVRSSQYMTEMTAQSTRKPT